MDVLVWDSGQECDGLRSSNRLHLLNTRFSGAPFPKSEVNTGRTYTGGGTVTILQLLTTSHCSLILGCVFFSVKTSGVDQIVMFT